MQIVWTDTKYWPLGVLFVTRYRDPFMYLRVRQTQVTGEMLSLRFYQIMFFEGRLLRSILALMGLFF